MKIKFLEGGVYSFKEAMLSVLIGVLLILLADPQNKVHVLLGGVSIMFGFFMARLEKVKVKV